MQAFGRPGSAAEGVGGWGVRGCGAAQMVSKLHMVLRPFLLRRMKAEVDQGLPKKKEIILWAGMAPTQKKFNDALVNKTINELLEQIASSGSGGAVARLKNVLMQLRKNCNHPDLLTGGLDGSISFPPARPVYYLPYYSAGYATCYFQLRTQRPEYPPVISPY